MIAHLAAGLRILGERWWSSPWITEGQTGVAKGVRRGVKTLLWMLLFSVVSASWPVLGVAVLIVVVRALRAATKDATTAKPEPAASTGAAPQQAPGEDRQDVPRDDFLTLTDKLIGTAPGVHLAALATALGPTWTIAHVRALATRHQVPVRPSVRDAAQRVSPGIHRADLPPLPEPLPDEAVAPPVGVVVAGQPATTAPTTTVPATPTTRTIGGVRVTSIPDPHNPHRTHISVAPAPKRA